MSPATWIFGNRLAHTARNSISTLSSSGPDSDGPANELGGRFFQGEFPEMRRNQVLMVSLGAAALAILAAIWKWPLPFESLLLRAAYLDVRARSATFDVAQFRWAVRFLATCWFLVAAVIPWISLVPDRIWRYLRPRIFQLSVTLGCSSALFILLLHCGYERPWYPLETLMKHPGSVPIFGQRLLWVWIADLCQRVAPSWSYLRCFYLSQALAIVLTVSMIGRWSGLFIHPSLRWTGQLLLVPMLSSTFTYFTFYDISIVFFYALCLYLLYRQRYFAFAIAIGIATLNHENVLLLVLLAGLETFRQKFRVFAGATLGALAVYVAVRLLMHHEFGTGQLVDWRIWTNLLYLMANPRKFVEPALALVFWWIAAGISWPDKEPFLRRVAILFPLLSATTFLYGQFHEARQFDALIPVAIAFMLSLARSKIREAETVPDSSRSERMAPRELALASSSSRFPAASEVLAER